MKRILSVLFVVLVLCCFSVSVFASDAYIPKEVSLVADSSNRCWVVPSGIDIYIGDIVAFTPPELDLKEYFGAPSEYQVVFPKVFEIYNNNVKISTLVSDDGNTVYLYLDEFMPGTVTLICTDYVAGGPGGWDVPSENLTVLSFEVKDPSEVVHPVESLPSVFESLMTMTSELIKTIVYYPLLLTFVVLCLVGLGIGIFCRVKK